MSVPDFSLDKLPVIHQDMLNITKREPKFLRYRQLKWMEVEADKDTPLSPDGEELMVRKFRIDVEKQRVPFVLPPGPLLGMD